MTTRNVDPIDHLNSSPHLSIHPSLTISPPAPTAPPPPPHHPLPSSTPHLTPPPTHHEPEPETDPFSDIGIKINSCFYDVPVFTSKFATNNNLTIASLNVQSLQSKLPALKEFIIETKLAFNIIALQETWTIHHPEFIVLPGYKFIHTNRKVNRGGGWLLHPG